jgi:hypothetical protein
MRELCARDAGIFHRGNDARASRLCGSLLALRLGKFEERIGPSLPDYGASATGSPTLKVGNSRRSAEQRVRLARILPFQASVRLSPREPFALRLVMTLLFE